MPATATARKPAAAKALPKAIDVHTHIRVPGVLDFLRKNPVKLKGGEDWFVPSSQANLAERDKKMWPVLTDPKVRMRDMDKRGVGIQVVSPNFPLSCYSMSPTKGEKAAQITNDEVAEFVARQPARFVGLANLPLQDAKRAAREYDRAVRQLDLRGAWIASNVQSKDLGEREFWPFWEKAEELQAPVFIHPLGTTDTSRLKKFFLWNTIGQPLEEAMAMSSLILEGVMDAFPRLKIVICHGGGYLPYYIGRSDHAWAGRDIVRANTKHPPSYYLKKFYYDTIVFDHDQLDMLVKKAGAGQILLGSDYPLVQEDPIPFVKSTRSLSKDVKDKIMWKNAAKLLKIKM